MFFVLLVCISSLEQNILVTNASNSPVLTSFSQSFNIGGSTSKQISSLVIKYDPNVCVKGFDFVYNDGTTVSTGYAGSATTVIDLNNKHLYSFKSYCVGICNYISVCTINMITMHNGCFDTGNTATQQLNNFIAVSSYCVIGMYGDFAIYSTTTNCLRQLGVSYFT